MTGKEEAVFRFFTSPFPRPFCSITAIEPSFVAKLLSTDSQTETRGCLDGNSYLGFQIAYDSLRRREKTPLSMSIL